MLRRAQDERKISDDFKVAPLVLQPAQDERSLIYPNLNKLGSGVR